LEMYDDRKSPEEAGTLAFDLTNGSLGALEACFVASRMIAAGNYRTALVMAAEIELNREIFPQRCLGLAETGSALILDGPADDGPGFGEFLFHSETGHLRKFVSHSAVIGGATTLSYERHPNFDEACLECIREAVERLLNRVGLSRSDIAVVLPPLISPE